MSLVLSNLYVFVFIKNEIQNLNKNWTESFQTNNFKKSYLNIFTIKITIVPIKPTLDVIDLPPLHR